MSVIPIYYKNYLKTKENFNTFHKQVINMPRDNFSCIKLDEVQSLCAYFLLIENLFDNKEGISYPEIRKLITEQIQKNKFPAKYRNQRLEEKFFSNKNKEGDIARLWRHPAEMAFFLGLLKKTNTGYKKKIDFEFCRKLYDNEKLFIEVMQNYWFYININSNEDIKAKQGIVITENANYRPTYAILKYLQKMGRPASLFEISILLGRIDELQSEDEILSRAIDIAKELPETNERHGQETYFFEKMQWLNEDGSLYSYNKSQEPYFKFKSYLLYLKIFGLINISDDDNVNSLLSLTNKAEQMLSDREIPIELKDLEELCSKVDDDNENEAELFSFIIYQRSPQILKAIEEDSVLIDKINQRAVRKTKYGNDGKRIRNKLVNELAKLKAKYTCEATGKKTFKMPNGQYYVEAHHIIEFSREKGPDVTDNIIVLAPEKHRLLHYGSIQEIDDLYNHLKTNGIINMQRFKNLHIKYKVLTKEHIDILFRKKLISSIDKEELLSMIKN